MTLRINLISGPRNISTALMYSWSNRLDTKVIDEPWYAYYLFRKQLNYHPGSNDILEYLPTNWDEVLNKLIFRKVDKPIYFIKGMSQHLLEEDLSFLLQIENVFLIRNPAKLITSFSKIINQPTIEDIGIKHEWEIFTYLQSKGIEPIVIDAYDILLDPKKVLKKLCSLLGVDFSERMLFWDKGPKEIDGIWAKYWYNNVWKSTCFNRPGNTENIVNEKHIDLYNEALIYYNKLKSYTI